MLTYFSLQFKAAREAGFSPKSAKVQAARLLTKVNLLTAFAEVSEQVVNLQLFKEIEEII